MAPNQYTLRLAAVFSDVVMHPAKRFRDVAENINHLHFRQQPIVYRYEHKAPVHKELRLLCNITLVTRLPATAVNPKHHRRMLCFRHCVNIERMKRTCRLGINDVLLGGSNWQQGNEDKET